MLAEFDAEIAKVTANYRRLLHDSSSEEVIEETMESLDNLVNHDLPLHRKQERGAGRPLFGERRTFLYIVKQDVLELYIMAKRADELDYSLGDLADFVDPDITNRNQ